MKNPIPAKIFIGKDREILKAPCHDQPKNKKNKVTDITHEISNLLKSEFSLQIATNPMIAKRSMITFSSKNIP